MASQKNTHIDWSVRGDAESRGSLPRRYVGYAVVALAVATLPWLGVADFHTRGEAREALVAQSMLVSGEWVLPRAYNAAIPSKPPLFHWLVLAASIPFGDVTEFTARLPSTLAAFGTLAFFLTALHKLLSTREQLLFTVLLALSFEWLRGSVTARVDMVHAACLSTGLLSAFFALERGGLSWWAAASTLFALATLGKGPVAIAVPSLALIVWLLVRYEARLAPARKVGGSLILALIVSLTWYTAAYLRAPVEFADKVWDENVARFAGTMRDDPHKHSIAFLVGMLLLGTLPWSPLVLWHAVRTRTCSIKGTQEIWTGSRPLVRFCLVSVISVISFYCVPSSKRGVYLLAAYPFLAVLSATLLRERVSLTAIRWVLTMGCGVVLVALTGALPFVIAPKTSERQLAAVIRKFTDLPSQCYSFGYEFYGAA